jgi:hypothetical protein
MVYPALIPLMRTPLLPVVNWTDVTCRFKWIRPFRRKMKSGFCACAITFQTQYNSRWLEMYCANHSTVPDLLLSLIPWVLFTNPLFVYSITKNWFSVIYYFSKWSHEKLKRGTLTILKRNKICTPSVTTISTRSPLLPCLSRHTQSGKWSSFGKRVWFTETHIILVISFYLFTRYILHTKKRRAI